MRRSQKPKSANGPATVMRRIGDATGVGGIARTALDGEKAVIDGLVAKARKFGVSEATIRKARALKTTHDRLLSVAAILFPWLPNPMLLRLLAGKPVADLEPPRAKRPARK